MYLRKDWASNLVDYVTYVSGHDRTIITLQSRRITSITFYRISRRLISSSIGIRISGQTKANIQQTIGVSVTRYTVSPLLLCMLTSIVQYKTCRINLQIRKWTQLFVALLVGVMVYSHWADSGTNGLYGTV